MDENEITYKIRGGVFEVHKILGAGLLESVYQEALLHELRSQGLHVEREVSVPVVYKGEKIKCDLKIDLLVEDKVIIELKSVEKLNDLHKKQLLTYLKLTGKKVGLLVNFNATDMNNESIVREVNGL